jgi:predicted ATPase
MISSLRLRNFKCFEDQRIGFRYLTLLSGLNGTGKSSVIQSLLLLRQSDQQGVLQKKGLALNGDLTHIGTAKDALFEGAGEDIIEFNVFLEDTSEGNWRFSCNQQSDVLGLVSPPNTNEIYKSSLFNNTINNFHYLQAERVGPRRFFETSDFLVHQNRQLGFSGEYTAHFLSTFDRDNISSDKLSHPEAVSPALKDQVEAWLSEISPGTRITLTPDFITDTVSLQYSFITGDQFSSKYRAMNVGFGITYVLPILVAVLSSSSPGSLLLVENPEAHLHPRGQYKMGELLALAASCKIQVVVETHSDHILNGIRVAVHDGKLKPDDVMLHFFQRRKKDGQPQVISPRMNRDGRIYPWPEGFFDEWTKSLEVLLEPNGE